MHRSNFEANFIEAKKALELSREEVNDFLKHETLSEKDRVRLTRVLQLVDRYKPERVVKESAIDKWRNYLESVYRFLPSKTKSQKPIENISARSYLVAEKTIASLRDLRHVNFELAQNNSFTEDEVFIQERPKEIVKKETLDTSLTLEYEKKNWGVERICLDGIQNHLPSDSKGEHVWIKCLIDNQWVSLTEARQKQNKIQAVRFADDGVGFDVKSLSLLYSTKSDESESRGQFGEGMKMMAAAALREGLEPEMESQDWRAKPVSKLVKIFNTRHQQEKNIEQLSFLVEHLDGKPMIGSRTTFHNPTKPFIAELMQIEEKVLALREKYRPEFVGSCGEIVDRKSGNIFVKGLFVTNKNTLFSYNFEDVETNRDRNTIVSEGWDKKIIQIIKEISDKKLVKTMLQKSILEPDAIESSYYNLDTAHPIVWKEGFYELFGNDAVLDTGFERPEVFNNKPLNKIKPPSGVRNLLLRAGITTDREATPDFWNETIPTSLTLKYGEDIWNEERILLDAVQNHLPADSGGTKIGLRFQTTDGQWHDFSELPDIPDEEVNSVKIYDNGRGYDSRLLGFFHSTKESSYSTGKFGEGLKMLCVASIRKNVDITLRSQNWSAKPRVSKQKIDGKEIDQLVFDVTHAVKKPERDNDNTINPSSSTTFSNLTPELLHEFRQINKKVLALENTQPVERTIFGNVLSLDGGMIYVRDLLIPGEHNLLFTYHLPNLDIKNRDRSFIDQQELTPAIEKIWSQIENPELIRSFLFKANLEARSNEDKINLEFTMNFIPRNTENWKKIFEEVFGKDTAIRDITSENYDAMQQNQHVGLKLISFPPTVFNILKRLGLPTY